MKNKKMKKLIELLTHELRHTMAQEPIREQIDWLEYDQKTSDKFKKMYLNLLTWGENLRIELSQSGNQISIWTEDITSIKKRRNSLGREEDYFRIEIIKGEGFRLNKGYNSQCNYSDPDMFDSLIEQTKNIKKEINRKNFESIYDQIMTESGLIRDNNLNELFKQ